MKQIAAVVGLFLVFSSLSAQRVLTLPGTYTDAVYVPARDALYAVRPATDPDGNTLVRIDMVTGEVLSSTFVGNDPHVLAATTSGDYLYVGFLGENRVRRYSLITDAVDREFTPGGDQDPLGPFYAEEILPVRGEDDLVAISLRNSCCSPRHEGVALFRNGEILPNTTPDHTGSNTIAYTDLDDVLIGYNNETTDFQLRRMSVAEDGLEVTNEYPGIDGFGVRIEYSGGRIYATNGQVATLSDGRPTLAGRSNLNGLAEYEGIAVEAVAPTGPVLYLGQGESGGLLLVAVDYTTLTQVGSYRLTGIQSGGGRALLQLDADDRYAFISTSGTLGLVTLCSSTITEQPPAYTGPTSLCYGEPLRLIAPATVRAQGNTIYWSDGQQGDTVFVTVPGNYSYRVGDANGCPGPDAPWFYVSEDYFPESAPGVRIPLSTVLCKDGSVQLAVDYYNGSAVVWNTGDTTETLVVTEAGSYSAYSLDAESGCPSESSEPITITAIEESAPEAPTVTLGTEIDTCTNQSIFLEATGSTGGYSWELFPWGQQSGSGVTVYPYEPSMNFSVTAISDGGCVSMPTTGVVNFLPAPDSPYLQYNGSTNTLAASAEGPILWYYQDVLEAETEGRFYTPARNGFYTARVRGNRCNSQPSNTILVDATTSVAILDPDRITVAPNPARDQITVAFTAGLAATFAGGQADYRLLSADGRSVAAGEFDVRLPKAEIPLRNPPPGVYTLVIEGRKGGSVRHRVVVL